MGVLKAVTNKMAAAYRRGSRLEKTAIPDQICELTGWHRDHARARLRAAGEIRVVRARSARRPVYSPRVVSGLALCWPVARLPAGKRLAPMLPVIVPLLRRRARAHRQRGRVALRYERGDDRPSAERCQVPRRDPRTLAYQAREPAQVPDTDPNLVGVGRGGSRFCRDRPRRPRRRELLRGVLLHPHHDRQVSRIESVSTRSRACSASSRS